MPTLDLEAVFRWYRTSLAGFDVDFEHALEQLPRLSVLP
jgi:hypothetical protein